MSLNPDKYGTVQKGGFWNCPRNVNISNETKELLSALMSEAKLTLIQRKEIQDNIGRGKSLPTRLSQHLAKEKTGKDLKPLPKPHKIGSGLRSKEEMMKSLDNEVIAGVPSICTVIPNREKERLQNYMAYGKDIVPKARGEPKEFAFEHSLTEENIRNNL